MLRPILERILARHTRLISLISHPQPSQSSKRRTATSQGWGLPTSCVVPQYSTINLRCITVLTTPRKYLYRHVFASLDLTSLLPEQRYSQGQAPRAGRTKTDRPARQTLGEQHRPHTPPPNPIVPTFRYQTPAAQVFAKLGSLLLPSRSCTQSTSHKFKLPLLDSQLPAPRAAQSPPLGGQGQHHYEMTSPCRRGL